MVFLGHVAPYKLLLASCLPSRPVAEICHYGTIEAAMVLLAISTGSATGASEQLTDELECLQIGVLNLEGASVPAAVKIG